MGASCLHPSPFLKPSIPLHVRSSLWLPCWVCLCVLCFSFPSLRAANTWTVEASIPGFYELKVERSSNGAPISYVASVGSPGPRAGYAGTWSGSIDVFKIPGWTVLHSVSGWPQATSVSGPLIPGQEYVFNFLWWTGQPATYVGKGSITNLVGGNPAIEPNLGPAPNRFRSAPVALSNPYDFPLTISYNQGGVPFGSTTLSPYSNKTVQIDSPAGGEIQLSARTPTGYASNGSGNLIVSPGAGGVSWNIGSVPAGESVAWVPGTPLPTGQATTQGTTNFIQGAGLGGAGANVQNVVTPESAPVAWNGAATGAGLTDAQYRQGVQATIAAIQAASGTGTGGVSSTGQIDPRSNIDAIKDKLVERWDKIDLETKKRREFGDAIATKYNAGVAGYDSGAAVAGVTGKEGQVQKPGSWSGKTVSVSDVSLPGSITVQLPDGTDKTLSWSASAMPGGLGGVASVAKGLLLLAASVAMVRGCMGDMRSYIVGLGAVNPAGNGVLVGVESVAPGVPQAKALGLALASTAVIAAAWVGMAALLTSGVLGDAFGRFGSMSLPSGLGVLSEWVPFSGLVMLWVGRAMFDFVAAPIYLGAVSALKFLSV